MSSPRYQGVFPVVPTTFAENGEIDLASQKRCVDFMIDAGSDGLCILANFSGAKRPAPPRCTAWAARWR